MKTYYAHFIEEKVQELIESVYDALPGIEEFDLWVEVKRGREPEIDLTTKVGRW